MAKVLLCAMVLLLCPLCFGTRDSPALEERLPTGVPKPTIDMDAFLVGWDDILDIAEEAFEQPTWVEPLAGLFEANRTVFVAATDGSDDPETCGDKETPCSSLAMALSLSNTVHLLEGNHTVAYSIGLAGRADVRIFGSSTANSTALKQGPLAGFTSCSQLLMVTNTSSFALTDVMVTRWTCKSLGCRSAFLMFLHVPSVALIDCTFRGVEVEGTSTLPFLGSALLHYASSDEIGHTTDVLGCYFNENGVVGSGGGPIGGGVLAIIGPLLRCRGSHFHHCVASVVAPSLVSGLGAGGAVFSTSSVDIVESLFDEVEVLVAAGGGRIAGGAVAIVQPSSNVVSGPKNLISITGCLFHRCQASGYQGSNPTAGGALFVHAKDAVVSIDSTSFVRNRGLGSSWNSVVVAGGAAALASRSTSVTNCTFLSNYILCRTGSQLGSSATGGSLLVHGLGGEALVADSLFQENFIGPSHARVLPVVEGSPVVGGALAMDAVALGTVERCMFTRNSATGGDSTIDVGGGAAGGAAYFLPADPGEVHVSNCTFEANFVLSGTAELLCGVAQGGAIASAGVVNVTDTVFLANLAEGGSPDNNLLIILAGRAEGGAIASLMGGLSCLRCTFEDNAAIGGNSTNSATESAYPVGGTVFASGSIDLRDSSFSRGRATGVARAKSLGGCLYVMEGTVNIVGCTFDSCFAGPEVGSESGHVGSFGGAVHLSLAPAFISGSSFTNNTSSSPGEAFGAAIFQKQCPLTIEGCVIANNSASGGDESAGGGAIYNEGSSSLSLSTTLFEGNMVNNARNASVGGAIHLTYYGLLSADETVTFKQCSADFGGAIYAHEMTLNPSLTWAPARMDSNYASLGSGAFLYRINNGENVTLSCPGDNPVAYECASGTRELKVLQPPPEAVWPGKSFSMSFALFDWFDQRLPQQLYSLRCNPDRDPAFVSGVPQDTILASDAGVYEVPQARVYASPGSLVRVGVVSQALDSWVENLENVFVAEVKVNVLTCPPGYFYDEPGCTPCDVADYNFDGSTCLACPEPGVPCMSYINAADETFTILQGNFPSSYTDPHMLTVCPRPESCIAQACTLTPNGGEWQVECGSCVDEGGLDCHCADGYTGRLCSKCVYNEQVCYYKANDECNAEDDLPFGLWMPLVEFLIYLVITVAWFSVRQDAESGTVKSLIFFLQTSAVFTQPILFGYGLVNLLAAVSSGIALNFLSIASLRCFSYTLLSSDIASLLILALLPTCLLLPCVLLVHFLRALRRHLKEEESDARGVAEPLLSQDSGDLAEPLLSPTSSSPPGSPGTRSRSSSVESSEAAAADAHLTWLQRFREDAIHSTAYIMYASYFGVCNIIFGTWACGKEQATALSMPYLECSLTTEWLPLVLISGILLLVLVIAPLVLFSILLVKADLDDEHIGLLRKIALAFSASVLNPAYSTFYVVPVMIMSIYSALQSYFAPYHTKHENTLEFAATGAVLIGFQASQYMAESAREMDVSQTLALLITLAAYSAFLITAMASVLRQLHVRYHKKARMFYGRLSLHVTSRLKLDFTDFDGL